MLRFGLAGLLVGMGLLAGCQGVSEPGSSTTEQSLGLCDMTMPQIVPWDGKPLEPIGPNSVFVLFRVSDKQQVASADESGGTTIVATGDGQTGEVQEAVKVDDDKLKTLAENAVRMERMVIPGTPPQPCVTQPTLCAPWLSSLVLRTHDALLGANDDYKSCQVK